MLKGLDSAFAPNATQAQQAAKAGVRVWGGYFAGRNILNGWTEAEFAILHSAGIHPVAYASGWEDPTALKALAAKWGVLGVLDVESGIRGDGRWVQRWLDASGFGLYGNAPVHTNRKAPFHVLAAYPGGNPPAATWEPGVAKPNTPTAWQFEGTHVAFGRGVDSSWWDDAIFAAPKRVVVFDVAGKEHRLLTSALLSLRSELQADAGIVKDKGGKMTETVTVRLK